MLRLAVIIFFIYIQWIPLLMRVTQLSVVSLLLPLPADYNPAPLGLSAIVFIVTNWSGLEIELYFLPTSGNRLCGVLFHWR